MKITLKNTRLSFEHLFKASDFKGDGNFVYDGTFLVAKNSENAKILNDAIAKIIADDFKGKPLTSDKICVKNGDFKEYEGYANHLYIKAKNKKRTPIVGRDRTPLIEEEGIVFSGCYVNAIIDIWPQDNVFGKRINAKLLGVQFVKKGDSFSKGSVVSEDDFEDFSKDSEDWAA